MTDTGPYDNDEESTMELDAHKLIAKLNDLDLDMPGTTIGDYTTAKGAPGPWHLKPE